MLLTPGSIPELAMRRCVLGKDTLSVFSIGPSNLPAVVDQPDEIIANRTQKMVLCVGVGSTDAEFLVHTNERTIRSAKMLKYQYFS